MNRRSRTVEIFSLSALDLFASGLGAFILLSVMMFQYYTKGKDYEKQIGDISAAVESSESSAASAEESVIVMAKQVEEPIPKTTVDLTPEQKALSAEMQRRAGLAAKLKEIQSEIEAAEKKIAASANVKEAPRFKVSFRFLGLKSNADNYLILVDGSRRMKDIATNLAPILRDIVAVLGPGKKYAIAFYDYDNNRSNYYRWPDSGLKEGGDETMKDALEFIRKRYDQMRGGSGTYQALRTALQAETIDSIILVSDGVVLPSHNENRDWTVVAREVTRLNVGKVEINTVAVGLFYRDAALWSFLNQLRKSNRGDIKAIMP